MIKIKRSYEPHTSDDGYRVLVDRLWPRGIKKADLKYDEWAKDLAPSSDLRKWFGHKSENWKSFKSKYLKELKSKEFSEELNALAKRSQKSTVTLLYSAHDEEHNQALVLKEYLEKLLK